MLIRFASLADIPAITSLYAYHVVHGTGSFENVPPTQEEMLTRYTSILAGDYPYYVAEKNGKILGYAYASSYRPRIGYRYTVEDSIYIDKDAQGLGIGKALLQELIKECTKRGFRQMVATIGDIRNSGSINVHRACGFIQVGNLPATGWKLGRWLDTVFMVLPLGEGETTPPSK